MNPFKAPRGDCQSYGIYNDERRKLIGRIRVESAVCFFGGMLGTMFWVIIFSFLHDGEDSLVMLLMYSGLGLWMVITGLYYLTRTIRANRLYKRAKAHMIGAL